MAGLDLKLLTTHQFPLLDIENLLLQLQLSHCQSGIMCQCCVASETRTGEPNPPYRYLRNGEIHTGAGNPVQIIYD